MEALGAISEGNWGSLSGMYTNEEADFMAQFLGNCQFLNELDGNRESVFWPGHHESTTMSLSGFNSSSYSYSGGSSNLFPSSSSQESYCFSSMSMDFCLEDANNTASFLIEGDECLSKENQPTNGSGMQIPEPGPEEIIIDHSSENSKKRSRGRIDAQKSKKTSRPRKNLKAVSPSNNDPEDNNNGGPPTRQTSSSGFSDNDYSNASQELKGNAALNLNGKTRASRGSATDPQSLYARKRRERINERLRILQSLVPNGTKVDISTMLEEAVQYVKFLQLQIKLLSSDDLWMYAPIAYNGKAIGLDLKFTAPR